jgi:HAMP domain-containing protein
MLAFYVCVHGLEPSPGWEYKDVVTLILTAVTIVLAALAIFIGLLAVWGYNSLREIAQARASDVATKVATTVAEKVAERTARETAASVGARSARDVLLLTDVLQDEAEALAKREGDS